MITPNTIRRSNWLVFGVVSSLLIIGVIAGRAILNNSVSAISGSDFNAGRIIDDSVFYNSTAMSASDIQSFLSTQVPTCDTNGTKPATDFGRPDLTHAQYAALKGWGSPPYTCIKDYFQDTPQIGAASGLCGGLDAQTHITAAQIIYNVSQACHLNPQVLIVLIQKEQGLISDTWPLTSEYTKATGFGCPDTNPPTCDPAYGGFFYQVYYAAKQFQIYRMDYLDPAHYGRTGGYDYNYAPNQNNNIYYSPTLSCGSSQVYIQNQATAALYIYTPYQPNAAALNNLYGTGDGCSSYGNRNFWRYFTQWFGTTYSPYFSASYQSQTVSPNNTVIAGDSVSVALRFMNTGNSFWKDDASTFPGYLPIHLAATNPINRWSSFLSSDWNSGSRPAVNFSKVYESDGVTLASDQYTVQPTQIVEFDFTMKVPVNYASGTYNECFQPILEGAAGYGWNIGGNTCVGLNVLAAKYTASYLGQSSYPNVIAGGASAPIFFDFKNSGNVNWYDDTSVPAGKYPVHLATSWPINRWSSFLSSDWNSGSRPAVNFSKVYESDGVTLAANQHVVQPGQIAEFDFSIQAPLNQASGFYQEYFQPILEGAPGYSWDMSSVVWMGVNVTR